MGGLGSGNYWHYGARNTVESCRRIDVRRWQREGYLTSFNWFGWQWTVDGKKVADIQVKTEEGKVTLIYRIRQGGGEWESIEEPITLDTTRGTYGGHRVWFRCPIVGCGRRVAILHLGDKYFACRHCYRLTYLSSRQGAWDRLSNQADKIRTRLGWEPGMVNPPGNKPKWMRWKTFERLIDKHNDFAGRSIQAMRMKFGELANEIFF